MQLDSVGGPIYIKGAAVQAFSCMHPHPVWVEHQVRDVYLVGGHIVQVLDTSRNLQWLLQQVEVE